MSQQTLAEKVGVTRQTIIAIEKDRYSPSLEVAFKISNEFGIPLEAVFNYNQGSRAKSKNDKLALKAVLERVASSLMAVELCY